MDIIERLKFRWNNNRDPLPGEVQPTTDGVSVVWVSEIEDVETSLLLRRLRGLITGYGGGWTFANALWDFSWGPLLIIAVTLGVILVYLLTIAIFNK